MTLLKLYDPKSSTISRVPRSTYNPRSESSIGIQKVQLLTEALKQAVLESETKPYPPHDQPTRMPTQGSTIRAPKTSQLDRDVLLEALQINGIRSIS